MTDDNPDPTLLFDFENADDLESLPQGSTIEVRSPEGKTLAEVDTAETHSHAYFREGSLVDGAGNEAVARAFYICDLTEE